MTILVTGATGDVGRPLFAERAAAGAHVRAVELRRHVAAQIRAGDVVAGRAAHRRPCGAADSPDRPPSLSNAGLVEVIAAVLDRPLRYREIPDDMARQGFVGLGFTTEFADACLAMLRQALEGRARGTHDVEKILGRPAVPFGQWVAEHRDLFTAST
ncbi:putative nucleoside-diphosphate sugar epimerase [Mycobacterium bohemicum DSM 44277]|uniref:NmrA-like domain-containing protein n=2 Tax=Mycobacterium bohemicum TaxID=56425 RepID=A0A1X1QVC1_MYCBE|nr:hypothetical protein AWB93_00400 [Mycobacterium bohemicum]CPR10798.1 putative nucleoside-diphosphate sugar epimerase [Mycobacterium bohemicum DSM 44277]